MRFNPEDDDNDDSDELDGLLNWWPARGSVNPNLPRITYIPQVSKISFLPHKEKNTYQALEGTWQLNLRCELIRGLSMQQVDKLVHPIRPKGESYEDFWSFVKIKQKGNRITFLRETPESLYVRLSDLPTWSGTLDVEVNLEIKPCIQELVFPVRKGKKTRENRTNQVQTAGTFLFSVIKELKKLYEKHGQLESFSDLYISELTVDKAGVVSIKYVLQKSPKEILNITADIKAEVLRGQEEIPEPKVTRADARKIRACGLVGLWTVGYSVNNVAELGLSQAHELLFATKQMKEEIREGHPLFEEYHQKELAMRAEEAEQGDEEFDLPPELEALIDEELARFQAEEGLDLDEEDAGDEEETEPVYYRKYVTSLCDRWGGCRASEAPTVILHIDYPLQAVVRLTIPPATVQTDVGEFKIMSPGYLMWVVAREYRKIYANHEEYGIWGHDINDLYFELFEFTEDGSLYMFIGS